MSYGMCFFVSVKPHRSAVSFICVLGRFRDRQDLGIGAELDLPGAFKPLFPGRDCLFLVFGGGVRVVAEVLAGYEPQAVDHLDYSFAFARLVFAVPYQRIIGVLKRPSRPARPFCCSCWPVIESAICGPLQRVVKPFRRLNQLELCPHHSVPPLRQEPICRSPRLSQSIDHILL